MLVKSGQVKMLE